MRPTDLTALALEHEQAVAEYCAVIRGLSDDRWRRPLSEGKWSPAEVTGHLVEGYQVARGELAGGTGMRVVVPPLRRWFLRQFLLPRLLRSGRFPPGVRAPRETRPRSVQPGPAEGISVLTAEALAFAADLADGARRGAHVTHAYFGPLAAHQALRLSIVHTRHHTRQVAAAAA